MRCRLYAFGLAPPPVEVTEMQKELLEEKRAEELCQALQNYLERIRLDEELVLKTSNGR